MNSEIILTLGILVFTIILFVTEKLRVDLVALIIMILLPWLKLITPQEAFSGLSSNAVISIIGVMILGYGIEKSGVMNYLTKPIIKLAGTNEKRLLAIIG